MKLTRLLLAPVAVVAALAVARADEWKTPEDGVLTQKMVDDYAAFLEAFAKFGGKYRGLTMSGLSKLEDKAANEASVSRDEIHWVRPNVDAIARTLLLLHAPKQAWPKAK